MNPMTPVDPMVEAAVAPAVPLAASLWRHFAESLRAGTVLLAALSLLCGLLYPLAITGVAQAALPVQANGSLIAHGDVVVGSALVGQGFTAQHYFWPRPSAVNHDAATSSGTNLGPNNAALHQAVRERAAALAVAGPVPVDLVTSSGSGLDPHISRAGALVQVERVARARGVAPAAVEALVAKLAEGDGAWDGPPRVNVLLLNLALDRTLSSSSESSPPAPTPAR